MKEPVELENYVKQLMLSTGFTREVLLAQIGRTELIQENKRPMYRHAARPLEEKNEGVDTGTSAAEKNCLFCLQREALSRERFRRRISSRPKEKRWRRNCLTA